MSDNTPPNTISDEDIQDFHIFPFIGLTLFTFYLAYTAEDGRAFKAMEKDFQSQRFILLLVVVAISAYAGLKNENIRGRRATQHALLAFIVAYFAHLDMPFASYFLIFVVIYYSHGWM